MVLGGEHTRQQEYHMIAYEFVRSNVPQDVFGALVLLLAVGQLRALGTMHLSCGMKSRCWRECRTVLRLHFFFSSAFSYDTRRV